MRWLKSFVFISVMALVASDSPNPMIRASLIRQPLINLAVQPIASDSVVDPDVPQTPEIMAPAQTGRRIIPYGGNQYWPGYDNSQNWYGYSPYFGGYGGYGGYSGYGGYGGYGGQRGQIQPRRWPRRYFGPRVVLPVEASTISSPASIETVPDVVDNTVAVETTAQVV